LPGFHASFVFRLPKHESNNTRGSWLIQRIRAGQTTFLWADMWIILWGSLATRKKEPRQAHRHAGLPRASGSVIRVIDETDARTHARVRPGDTKSLVPKQRR